MNSMNFKSKTLSAALLLAFAATAGAQVVQGTGPGTAVGTGSNAETGSVAVGENAKAGATDGLTYTSGIAIGNFSKATGLSRIAIGNFANGSGNNSITIGDGAESSGVGSVTVGGGGTAKAVQSVGLGLATVVSANATSAVALGAGSEATEAYVVSVGNDTVKRRIVNVANGIAVNDAATYGQVKDVDAKAISAKATAEQARDGLVILNTQVVKNSQQALAGVAGSMAMVSAATSTPVGEEGEITGGVGIASYGGQTAMSANLKRVYEGRIYTGTVSSSEGGNYGVSAGVGFRFR